jgi:hypothetical protein
VPVALNWRIVSSESTVVAYHVVRSLGFTAMKFETFNASINALRKLRAFTPFTVGLSDGEQFEVDHPSAIIHRGGTVDYVNRGGVPMIFDHEGVTRIVGALKRTAGRVITQNEQGALWLANPMNNQS